MRTRRVQDAAPAPDCGQHEPLGGIAGALWGDSSAPAESARGAASKEQEWVALDKGLRNAGKPPASAFRIPELGEEVELASVPASITREQFWWVMTKWMEGGESYIRSVWRTQELRQGDPELGQDEWTWAAKFRPRARTQVAQDGGGSGEQGGSVPGGVGRDGASGLAGEGAAAAARARLGGPEVGAPLSPAAAAAEVTTLWASLVAGAWHRAAQAAVAKPQAQPDQGVLASADGHGEAQHAPHVAAPLHTLRRMWRKDVITAPYLDEWCSVYREGCGEQGVSFTPVLPAWVEEESFRKPVMSYLPYNYPKSLRYAFYFVPPQNPSARPHLRMTAHLFDKGSQEFLATTAQRLLTKLDKWGRCVSGAGETATTSYQKRVEHDSLVEEHKFRNIYQRLKAEHKHWAKQWPEKTDPQKFVFEETGIAAYLIALWSTERFGGEKQTFVDLGCGNGFLTYLLTMAGHVGCGIDKQKRKIWDIYGGDTTARLVVEEIDPETCEYPGVDWVIGNHSDELTPWLPKIARRCGPGTRYFVIPCCFWDFTRRFSKKAHGQTRYETYLNFIATCGREEGFQVFTEALRIPSTKNMAQVGDRIADTQGECAGEARAQGR